MGNDTLQSLLGPGALTAFMLALFGLYQKLRENRTTLRAAREVRDALWNSAYRAGAEAHLVWDQDLLIVIYEMRSEIQSLRAEMGKPPREFLSLPKAPPLFPSRVDGVHPGDQRD